MSSTGTGEGRTGSRRRQSKANNYSISNINRKRKANYTWTGQFICLSDCHAKKYQHQQKNKCYRRQVWGLKINVVMSAKTLKAAAGQGKIYTRPIQRSLSVIPLESETSSFSYSVLKEKCVCCLKEFPLQRLRAHLLTCLSSSYLSDDDTDDVGEKMVLLPMLNPAMIIIQKETEVLTSLTIFQAQKSLMLPTLLKLLCQQIQL